MSRLLVLAGQALPVSGPPPPHLGLSPRGPGLRDPWDSWETLRRQLFPSPFFGTVFLVYHPPPGLAGSKGQPCSHETLTSAAVPSQLPTDAPSPAQLILGPLPSQVWPWHRRARAFWLCSRAQGILGGGQAGHGPGAGGIRRLRAQRPPGLGWARTALCVCVCACVSWGSPLSPEMTLSQPLCSCGSSSASVAVTSHGLPCFEGQGRVVGREQQEEQVGGAVRRRLAGASGS